MSGTSLIFRLCYFTSASTNCKSDFIKELSASYRLACLTCLFTDKELGDYFQFKKRQAGILPLKYAVVHVDNQSDGTWVLGNNAHFSSDGTVLPVKDSKYVWLGHIFRGVSVATDNHQCSIEMPLTTDPLAQLLTSLQNCVVHNFYPRIITMAGM